MMKTYLIEYEHDGKEWIVEVKADSLDDAQARKLAMYRGVVIGELMMTIPACGTGWLVRAVCAARNWIHGS